MLSADPISIWLWYKNPRLYITLVVLAALGYFGYYAYRHYFPPVVKNYELTEAVEKFVNRKLGKEDFFLEGEVKDIEVTRVFIHEQTESGYAPNSGTLLVGIRGTYYQIVDGKEPKLKQFKVKHRMDYEKKGGVYTIKYKLLPHIRYF